MAHYDGHLGRWNSRALATSRAETACARLLSLAGLLVFTAAPLWAVNDHQMIFKDGHMWLKALGLICAGVFVGAALIEAKQLLRNRKRQRGEAPPDERDVRQLTAAEAQPHEAR